VDLHAAHLLDALAGAGERERDEIVGESGVDPGDEDARVALIPAARMRMMSAIASGSRVSPMAQYTTHSGLVARTASRSPTAAMPVTVPASRPTPHSSPASLPTFSGVDTHTPVSSNCGLVISSAKASPPTFPVPTCATRIAMTVSVREGSKLF
jgi:hypothetical protein